VETTRGQSKVHVWINAHKTIFPQLKNINWVDLGLVDNAKGNYKADFEAESVPLYFVIERSLQE